MIFSGRADKSASPISCPANGRNIHLPGNAWCGAIPHASHIVGWPIPEGRLLLYDLMLYATRPEFVYSHKWRVGDLVIWDNRCTMHRGRPHDDAHPRDLRRATTLAIGSTLDEAA
jgi:TfdA family taurine catabolism dioxygenase TauD